jgi:hypothetical protein
MPKDQRTDPDIADLADAVLALVRLAGWAVRWAALGVAVWTAFLLVGSIFSH